MNIQWTKSKTNAMQRIGLVNSEAHFTITQYKHGLELVSIKEKGRPKFNGSLEACKNRAEQLMEALV